MQRIERDVFTAILLGGMIAAAIDIGAASVISGRNPGFILQAIAGGLLAKASFEGGAWTMMLGAVLQEVMGILIAAIYVLLAKSIPVLLRRWIISGLGYGVVIFFVMNYVVVPLSAWKAAPHFTAAKFAANMAAMLLFGLIVAFFSRRITVSAKLPHDEAVTPA
ncbi:MAG TPA: hypothetical protein VHS76_07765 [Steroidobacteraceae bacterium]|jgi:hypothetical protein|nr:hypothetical protein [Steroidobacteraceae bacterium]